MALLKFTNPSTTNTVVIDVDAGDRDDRYSKYRVSPSGVLNVDEADVNPYNGEGADCNSLPSALAGGLLTVTESHLDNITDLTKRNFIAGGLGLKYFYSAQSVVNTYVCVADSDGKLIYDTTLGVTPNVGVVRKDSSTGEYVRTKVSGTATVVCSTAVTTGDKVAGYTDGKVRKVTETGQYYVGVALEDGTASQAISITVNPSVI